MLAGIAIGGALSWVLASPALAMASVAAFVIAELVDWFVFSRFRQDSFIKAAAVSNLVSAPVDTFVFLWIAGFPLTATVIVGQLVGKLLWATAVPLFIYWLVTRRRAVSA